MYSVKIFPLIIVIILFFISTDAQAIQVHGHPEGLYVHQMAHITFALSMIFLLYMLNKRPLGNCPGWRYLKFSVFFFLLWNVDTLIAHALGVELPAEAIKGTTLLEKTLVGPFDWKRTLFYITKNDHFLCVPAMIFMVMFLRTFYHENLNAMKEETELEKKKGSDS